MRITVSVLAILFGLLHIAAAVVQFKRETDRRPGVIMLCGGAAVVCTSIAHLTGSDGNAALQVLMGSMLICLAAYMNGSRAGKVHLSHHIVRGGIAVLLAAGFLIW